MSVTKKDIAAALAESIEINHAQALQITTDFFDFIKEALASGEAVKLSGFGNFILREKSARPGRNPKTGEAAEICARKVVIFRAGPKLKSATMNNL